MKTVAILSQSAPMAAAIQMLLTPRLPNAEFVTVSKVTELPEGDVTVASLGIPNFLPTDRVSEVLNVNTAYESDPAIRSKNWDYMRSDDADPADLIQLLGGADSYKVIPSRKAMAVRFLIASRVWAKT